MTIIKIGGQCANNETLMIALADEILPLHTNKEKILLVHGGGNAISRLQKQYALEPLFIQGLRQTSPEEMPLVDMALAGGVNKQLVRLFQSRGLPAWGISGADGNILLGHSIIDNEELNKTGLIDTVSKAPLHLLWSANFFPILAPPGTSLSGTGLNFNADEAALSLACALSADRLVFISDVPGILKENRLIPILTPAEAEILLREGIVTGGMIPKLEAALGGIKAEIKAIYIATYRNPGDLKRIFDGNTGTKIMEHSSK